MYLLDTNICIFMMRQSSPSVIARIEKLDPASLFLSAVTVHELHFGAEKRNWGEKHRQNLKLFCNHCTSLPFLFSLRHRIERVEIAVFRH